jgi:hypothetical protein
MQQENSVTKQAITELVALKCKTWQSKLGSLPNFIVQNCLLSTPARRDSRMKATAVQRKTNIIQDLKA